jgi:hypothetical protein
MNDFTSRLVLEADAQRIYAGLTESIDQWWTELFEGSSQEPGQIFSISFGPLVRKTMMVETLVPREKVAWLVVDSLIDLPELSNREEWTGTRILWEISRNAGNTVLQLKHHGLTPEIECYQLCTSGWQTFLQSFEQYISTGVGTPFRLAKV